MKLIIPAPIERKLNAYAQGVDGEIAGMGKVEMREDGNIYVLDVTIYDQEVTGGTADLSSQALAFFQTELIKKGESPRDWYLWWHSHVNMSAFFSATDTGTIDSSDEFQHLISLVINKKRERKARLDTHHPFRLTMLDLAIEIQAEANAPLMERTKEIEDQVSELMDELSTIHKEADKDIPGGIEALTAEIEAKVKIKRYNHTPYKGGGNVGFGSHNKRDNSYLQLDFDEGWSKKRKKGGSVITIEEIVEGRYDSDEIDILIETTRRLVMAHAGNGNADSAECLDLREQLKEFVQLKIDLDSGYYDEEDQFWTGFRWMKTNDYIAETYQDADYSEPDFDPLLDVPPYPRVNLLAPYQHDDFDSPRDDERA